MTNVTNVLVPPNREGTRATVLRWCKGVGDHVLKDEPLVELETDKVTVEIASPADGGMPRAAPIPAKADAPAVRAGRTPLSPSVRRLLRENSLAADDIAGTGRNGRITAHDVTLHISAGTAGRDVAPRSNIPTADARAATWAATTSATPPTLPTRPASHAPAAELPPGNQRIPHSAIRRRVAEHMARSVAEAPHVTTLFEVDLTRVLAHRVRHCSAYESRGARLTLTAYFISACVGALRAHPELNATFFADAMELHADVNIGVGTALGDRGLIVPVIRRAQELNLFGVAQRLGQMVEAARGGKLTPDDVRGGTFTLSNHGVGGSLLAAPIIINQPQVAILGVGKLQRRVCVVEVDGAEAISVRSMCYITLTIDHRALDAFQANAFLSKVTTTLENWPEDDS